MKGVTLLTKPIRKFRKPIQNLLVFGGIILLTTLAIVFILSNESLKFKKTQAETEINEPVNNTLTKTNSQFPEISIITDFSDDVYTPFKLVYPQTDNDHFNASILTYITETKNDYLTTMNNNINNEKKDTTVSGELNIGLEIFQHNEIYYSFVLTTVVYTGGENQRTSTKTFFYNLETGEMLDLKSLLNGNDNNLIKLATYVRGQLEQHPQLKNQILVEKLETTTKPVWTNFQCFAIKDESLLIYFNEYEVASGVVGSPVIAVELSFINPILATEFQAKNIQVNHATIINPNTKRVALTFDDGPRPEVTMRILQSLEKYKAKATFYMLGKSVQQSPETAKEVLTRGHEIGNHTWSHPILTKLTKEQILNEYNSTSEAIFNATGQYATTFRPPYGAINDFVNAQIPLPIAIWSIDTLDWKHKNAQTLLTIVKKSIHNNAIILMHDIHSSTADGLEPLLAYLQEQGYEFVTVSEINKYKE